MLIEFSVGNFLSFKEIETINMQAAKIKSKFPNVDKENLFNFKNKFSLLKSKAIYGANASGKSNLIKGLKSMQIMITDSVKNENFSKMMSFDFFALNEENEKKPIFYQIIFIYNEIIFRYGFQIAKGKVESEWLFGTPKERESYYFIRTGQEVKVNKSTFKEAKQFISNKKEERPLYRPDALLLTVMASFNRQLAKDLLTYISNIKIISGLHDENIDEVLDSFSDDDVTKKLNSIVKSIDGNIDFLQKGEIENIDLPDFFPEAVKKYFSQKEKGVILVNRNRYNSEGKRIGSRPILLDVAEGEGTKKLIIMSPLILDVCENGGVLIVDEFDARLHPNLTRKILNLFHSKKTNPKNAQLIFATHDSNLLDAKLLRRDQICFVEKGKYGASTLTSLVEFKGIRNDASFEKDYLKGKYGGVPNLNKFEWAFEQNEIE